MVESTHYKIFSIITVFLALFLYDFSRAFLSVDSDKPVEIILIVIFGALTFDVTAQCACYSGYLFSFFFYLDVLGTLTVLTDISVTWQLMGFSQASFTI